MAVLVNPITLLTLLLLAHFRAFGDLTYEKDDFWYEERQDSQDESHLEDHQGDSPLLEGEDQSASIGGEEDQSASTGGKRDQSASIGGEEDQSTSTGGEEDQSASIGGEEDQSASIGGDADGGTHAVSSEGFSLVHGPIPSYDLLNKYNSGCGTAANGAVGWRKEPWKLDDVVHVTLSLSTGYLRLHDPRGESSASLMSVEPSEGTPETPILAEWQLNDDVEVPETEDGTCFKLQKELETDGLTLCPPSIRLRDFWMVLIEQEILCSLESDPLGQLPFVPKKVAKNNALEREMEEEQLEEIPKRLVMEFGPDVDGAIPVLTIDDIEIPFEAHVSELQHEDLIQPPVSSHSSIQAHRPPSPQTKTEDEGEAQVLIIHPEDAIALAESLSNSNTIPEADQPWISRHGHHQFWKRGVYAA